MFSLAMLRNKKILKKLNRSWLLLVILLVAFLVRVWGVSFGLPYYYHADEVTIVSTSLNILKNRTLNPNYFGYPSFSFYFLTLFYLPLYLLRKHLNIYPYVDVPGAMDLYYFYGRLLAASLGVLCVYLLYGITKKLFNRKIGLVATLLLALNFSHVAHSHYVKMDIALSVLSLLILWFAFKIYEKGETKFYLITGVLIGLTNATKYSPFLVVYLIIAHLLRQRENKKKIINLQIVYGFLFCVVGFSIGTPYIAFSPVRMTEIIRKYTSVFFSKSNVLVFSSSEGDTSSLGFYLLHLFYLGMTPLLFILSFLGIYPTIKKLGTKISFLFFSFPILYFLSIAGSRLRFDRYIIPVLPFLVIFASLAIDTLFNFFQRKLRRGRVIASTVLLIALLLVPVSKILYFDWAIAKNERVSRDKAYNWIQENFRNREAILLVGVLQTVGGRLWTLRNDYPLIWEPVLNEELDYFSSKGFRYLVDANYNLTKNYPIADKYSKVNEQYKFLLDNGYLVKEIYDQRFESWLGIEGYEGSASLMMTHTPHIRIFKLPDFLEGEATTHRYDEDNIKCGGWSVVDDEEAINKRSLMSAEGPGIELCYFIDIFGQGVYEYEIRYKWEKGRVEDLFFQVVKGGTMKIFKDVPLKPTGSEYKTTKFDFELLEDTQGQLTFQFSPAPLLEEQIYVDYVSIKRKS